MSDTHVDPGLCTDCAMAVVQPNHRGSTFWRCRRADSDPGFLQYPPLPVSRCDGFVEGVPCRPPTEETP